MTTVPDAGDELVDVVDEDDRVVATVTRRRMRAERLRHRAVFIVVNSSAGALLVHRRSDAKDLWPGWWDVAAGGVVAAGEGYDAAAHRELAEEIGVAGTALVPIGGGRFVDGDVDLIARCYRVVHDGPFRFADGEVVEARWVDPAQLAALRAVAQFVPDSVDMLPTEILFPFPPARDPQDR